MTTVPQGRIPGFLGNRPCGTRRYPAGAGRPGNDGYLVTDR